MKPVTLYRALLAAALFGIYAATLAPSLTWAHQGADGGDLITAAASGSAAHPSGYPTYLVLARLFQFIPIGGLAFRTNLMSAVFAVSAALLVYEIFRAEQNPLAGVVSALALGLSPLFWSQAIITEVYTLHIFFIALILYLRQTDARHVLLGLVFGLGAGNHITTVLLLPILYDSRRNVFLRRATGILLGLMIYLTLPLRAAAHPPVNWGNPVTLHNFLWLVTGELYHAQFFMPTMESLWTRFQATSALLTDQFTILGLGLGFLGLVVSQNLARQKPAMLWVVFAFLAFPFVYDTRDSFMYLLPVFLCFAMWIGAGVSTLMESAPRFKLLVGWLFVALILLRAGGLWSRVDASDDLRAEDFGRRMMSAIPEESIVFAKGDRAVLTLWYFHYALKQRPDVAIIASDLLPHEWYQENLRRTYPALNLPDDFFMFETEISVRNPHRKICRVEYSLICEE